VSPTQTAPVGATVSVRWKDMPEELVFEEYVSFGNYDEEEEDDGLGMQDLHIFCYVEGVEELESMKYANPNYEWLVSEIVELHYLEKRELI
jgi:hypothetical protein